MFIILGYREIFSVSGNRISHLFKESSEQSNSFPPSNLRTTQKLLQFSTFLIK